QLRLTRNHPGAHWPVRVCIEVEAARVSSRPTSSRQTIDWPPEAEVGVGEHSQAGAPPVPPARPDWISSSNNDDPSAMTARERLLEVAGILAAGLRRRMGRGGGGSTISLESEPGGLELPEHAGRHLTGPAVNAPETENRP